MLSGAFGSDTYDRINVKIGKWRIFIAFLMGAVYFAVYPIDQKWLTFISPVD